MRAASKQEDSRTGGCASTSWVIWWRQPAKGPPSSRITLPKPFGGAKRRQGTTYLERFEFVICGLEVAHAFTELTDSYEQRARMTTLQEEQTQCGEDEQALDGDFLEALDIGLPPTVGLGVGIDRILMLVHGVPLSNVVTFPPGVPDLGRE
jgi:lysyl-tRNA synthetase class II